MPIKHWSFSRNTPVALCSSGPPSTLLPAFSIPALSLILSSDAAQVILQDQRSILEVQFRLPTSLSDGIAFPHHQVQAPGTSAFMPQNRLHLILLLTIDHNGRRWSLLPFELFQPVEPFQVRDMKDRMDPPTLVKIGPFYPVFTPGRPQWGKNGVKLLAGC